MHRQEALDALDIDEHLAFDDEIGTEADSHLDAVVDDRNRELPYERQPGLGQLMRDAAVVHALEHPGPERPMHLHRAIEHRRRDWRRD
jgi:hypothetical protein